MGFLWFYLCFFKAEQCSEGHFRWEQDAMVLTGYPRLGAHSSVLKVTVFTWEHEAKVLTGNPTLGAQATSLTQSL